MKRMKSLDIEPLSAAMDLINPFSHNESSGYGVLGQLRSQPLSLGIDRLGIPVPVKTIQISERWKEGVFGDRALDDVAATGLQREGRGRPARVRRDNGPHDGQVLREIA